MVKTVLGLILSVSLLKSPATTINYLVEHALTRDRQTVVLEAEAIGEVLERGENAWVNVNDGTNAIGIYMTAQQAKSIQNFGSYAQSGDWIRITGTFYRACPEHGGEMDIHAASVTILRDGQPLDHIVTGLKFVLTLMALSLALTLIFIKRHLFRKKRVSID